MENQSKWNGYNRILKTKWGGKNEEKKRLDCIREC